MISVVFDTDVPYSLDGVKVIDARKGERHELPDDLAASLMAANFAHVPRGRKPRLETPESQADEND